MANTNAPFGARLITSEGKEHRVRRYPKKSGNVIAEGDFVINDATGAVEIASAGVALLGVACEYKAATDTSDIAIIDDPEAVFELQANSGVFAADVFQNADIAVASYDSALKRSKHVLDVASMGTTATLQLKILGLSKIDDNAYGSFARVLVKINNHKFKGGTGTVGV
jgi:hypothetical protein